MMSRALNTLQKLALLLALVGATGSLSAVEVKLINTGKMTWDVLESGYWIEYEIDGKRMRSDKDAGQRTNQLAWELMSEEDKLKVIDAYGMGGINARIAQFGSDGAQKIADKVNDDTGWTAAHEKYTEALVYRDYPTHAAIFNTEQSRDAYFNENFVPSCPILDEEMGMIMDEQQLLWKWATEAYLAVKRGNEKRIDTAAKALSGDLIALICDKVLVPNITATNPIELGFKYGIRKEVLGSLFDYINSITTLGDTLVNEVVGERATGDSGAELIDKLTDLINMDLHLINTCMARLRSNKSELESMYSQKTVESEKKAQERTQKAEAERQATDQRVAAAPVTGYPVDEAIDRTCKNYQSEINELLREREGVTNTERLERLDQQIASKQADYAGYRNLIIADVEGRFASFASDFAAAYSAWYSQMPSTVIPYPLDVNAPDYFIGYTYWSSFRISAAKAQSDVGAYVQYHKELNAAWPDWCEEGNALVINYRNRYQEILTDANAVGYGGNRHEDIIRSLDAIVSECNSAAHVNAGEELIERQETRLKFYLEALAQHENEVVRNTARREELRSNFDLAAAAYEKAHDDMMEVLNGLPNFLDGCSADETKILRVPQDSALRQTVFGGNADGNAALLRQYCREVNELYAKYQNAALRKENARAQALAMFPGDGAQFTDLYMPPECYANLHLLEAAVRDFNVQNREGELLNYYVTLADNEDYYAEKRDQLVRSVKSPTLMSASVSAEELPTYAKICNDINSLLNNPTGFADGVKGYSPDESGGVFEKLIAPIQSVIEGRRNALTWDYSIEGGQAKIWGVEGVVSGAVAIPDAFEGCPVTELGDYLFTGSGMTSVVIPESVVTIGSCAFSGCRQLGAVRIPAKVASIGEWAFAGCDSLMKIEVAADNVAYQAVNGLLFAKGGTDPIAGIGGDVTVPVGVKRIGTELFYERALGSVTLPPGVVEIGERAFAYSTLTEITIPSSVTTIAGDAFYSCDRLVTVYVDQGDDFRVRELLRNTGASLSRITFVSEFTEMVDGIEWSYGTKNGEAVVTSIPRKPEGESYGKVEVPSTLGGLAVTAIGNSVFVWRSDITEVVIPHGVRSIGDFAFNSSPSIVAVSIPESVTTLGELTFAYSSLTTVRTVKGDSDRVKTLLKSAGLNVSPQYEESLPKREGVISPTGDSTVVCMIKDEYRTKADVGVIPVEVVNVKEAVKIAVKGLPSGVKFTAKDVKATAKSAAVPANSIYGTPTKSGVYAATVTVTPTDKKSKMASIVKGVLFVVRNPGEHIVVADYDVAQGSVKGMGVYAPGKKVTLKATAVKGWVFSGWYNGDVLVSRLASYVLTMPEVDVYLAARFVTAAEDKGSIGLKVDGRALSGTSGGTPLPRDVVVKQGMYIEWPVAALALSATTVKVSGLPSGLKFTAKDVKATKTSAAVPANTIYGTPKTASKVDKDGKVTPSKVKITVTTAGKAKQEYVINVTVRGIPAEGTFNGGSANGLVTLTVAKTGKISGKYLADGKTWTLSAAGFDTWDDNDRLTATLTAKSGKEVKTLKLVYEDGYFTSSLFEAWRNEWKTEPLKTLATKLKGQKAQVGEVLLTVGASGAVTAKGTFGSYSASCSTVLIPTETEGRYTVYLYFPPKAGKFAGWVGTVYITTE